MRFFLLKYLTYICNKIIYMGLSKKNVYDLSKHHTQIYYKELVIYLSLILLSYVSLELTFYYYDADISPTNITLYYVSLIGCILLSLLLLICTIGILVIISNTNKKIKIHNGFDNFVIYHTSDGIVGEEYSYTFKRLYSCSKDSNKYSTISNLEYYVDVSAYLYKAYSDILEDPSKKVTFYKEIDYKFR